MKSSFPVTPAQPDAATYGTQSLELFRRFTQASFLAFYGTLAPQFDPTQNAKDWQDDSADTSDPINVTPYKVVGINGAGNPVLKQYVPKSIYAAMVNLPADGTVTYPPYVVAPTGTQRSGPGDLTPQPVNPNYLSTRDQAAAIMGEVGGTAVVEESPLGGGFGTIYPVTESRRLFDITFNGRGVNVGLLLFNKNSHGVGAPGKWDLTGQEPVWVPDAPVVADINAPHTWAPRPVRNLLPNEQLQATLAGVEIVRTDRVPAAQAQTAAWNTTDRQMLTEVHSAIVK